MKIAILGYGKEGKSSERYFLNRGDAVEIFDNLTAEDIDKLDLSGFDLILRSPSMHPRDGFSSMTKYFFEHKKAPVIGVTGTKGKGTTCSLITGILRALGFNVYLVGNIGNPSLNVLDELKPEDVVVYEMSSFQLWDLTVSPEVAVVLRIEADHLNVHDGFDDYVAAKGHIAEYQKPEDTLVYFKNNQWSREIAEKSKALSKFSYPLDEKPAGLVELLDNLAIPGEHNRENAEAALLAVAGFLKITLEELTLKYATQIKEAFAEFKGLPHHIEFVRTLNGVDYYDDSFSASEPSLEVAVKAFSNRPVVLIAGGKDRGLDLTPIRAAIFTPKNMKKVFLMGETKNGLAMGADMARYETVETLEEAVLKARELAEELAAGGERPVILLSPGAASFDMFKDFYDRGDQFQALVKGLK